MNRRRFLYSLALPFLGSPIARLLCNPDHEELQEFWDFVEDHNFIPEADLRIANVIKIYAEFVAFAAPERGKIISVDFADVRQMSIDPENTSENMVSVMGIGEASGPPREGRATRAAEAAILDLKLQLLQISSRSSSARFDQLNRGGR